MDPASGDGTVAAAKMSASEKNTRTKNGKEQAEEDSDAEIELTEPLTLYEGHPSQRMLRVMTYLCPGVMVGIFEDMCNMLEKVTGLPTYLMYESRWSGPPTGRDDPFTTDACDIACMCSTAYLSLRQRKCQAMELCKAAPLHSHKRADGQPVYFSEVVIHARNEERFKKFSDFKGSRFAYNDEMSLSGNVAIMVEVKKNGYGAQFFGDKIKSGNHMESLDMVYTGRADVAAIDSNSLRSYQCTYPDRAKDLVVFESIGPLPIYPIVFNRRLSDELKEKITNAFLHMEKQPEFSQRLFQKGVIGYAKIDQSFYKMEKEIREQVKQMLVNTTYY